MSNQTDKRAATCARLFTTHGARKGLKRTTTYRSWEAMLRRCRNKSDRQYPKYGGRGVTVCERWLSFANFLADMGERPTAAHTIDRHPNGKGNYEPGNCRWATATQQARNISSNRMIEHGGKTLCLAEWAELAGIKSATLAWRLKNGWTMDRSITTPPRKTGD